MSAKGRPRVDELIQSISLHIPNPVVFHGTVAPFMIIYSSWLYLWVFVYGVNEYYEAGLVTLVGIAFVQIFTCLCCFWSVHFRAFTSCRKVSWNLTKKIKEKEKKTFSWIFSILKSSVCLSILEQFTSDSCIS